ncbi:hypothetical protein BARVI_07930 [Barnesiella viscericola DSM 18177]|uniref:Uncharacterized protein n=1 Tax=Barnesiella viscericola DSM 18177 TaxID=880074 RepID=W0EST7_9BACT|nr:hypothetical protein BARVI_07930 [Barnesiella viscericola DSM 18177]
MANLFLFLQMYSICGRSQTLSTQKPSPGLNFLEKMTKKSALFIHAFLSNSPIFVTSPVNDVNDSFEKDVFT